MSDPSKLPMCYVEDPDDFAESVASYECGPLTEAMAPTRAVQFVLEIPFAVKPDDIIIAGVYSEGRAIEHRFYDGPPPQGGQIDANLPVRAVDDAETFNLSVELIRSSGNMTCGWSLEERFTVPAQPQPHTVRVTLLSDVVETDTGDPRATLITVTGP